MPHAVAHRGSHRTDATFEERLADRIAALAVAGQHRLQLGQGRRRLFRETRQRIGGEAVEKLRVAKVADHHAAPQGQRTGSWEGKRWAERVNLGGLRDIKKKT